MMEQDVAGGDRLEDVGLIHERGRDVGRERRVAQVGPGEERDCRECREPERALRLVEILLVDLELLKEERADAVGHAGRHLEPDDGAEFPAPDLPVDDRKQVVRLLLADFHVHVARDAEGVAAEDFHAREEVVRFAAINASIGRKSAVAESPGSRFARSIASRGTKRGGSGTFTRANFRSRDSGSRASIASETDRLERNGKGCPGSTASGVRTGKTARRK
jgi:hypothetical protein